jgi:hypothetical protein
VRNNRFFERASIRVIRGRNRGRVMSWSREDLNPSLEKKRATGLIIVGKRVSLEGEGTEG